jgi:hypothetical protein
MTDQRLITSVRLMRGPGHDYLRVFNRGAPAGNLTVCKDDGILIVNLLLGEHWDMLAVSGESWFECRPFDPAERLVEGGP